MTCVDCGRARTMPRSKRCGPCALIHRGTRALRKTSGICGCGAKAKRGSLWCATCSREHRRAQIREACTRYRRSHPEVLRERNAARRQKYLMVRIARTEAKLARLKALVTEPTREP